jgi:hypothetical protein
MNGFWPKNLPFINKTMDSAWEGSICACLSLTYGKQPFISNGLQVESSRGMTRRKSIKSRKGRVAVSIIH